MTENFASMHRKALKNGYVPLASQMKLAVSGPPRGGEARRRVADRAEGPAGVESRMRQAMGTEEFNSAIDQR